MEDARRSDIIQFSRSDLANLAVLCMLTLLVMKPEYCCKTTPVPWLLIPWLFNTLRPRQNGRRFTDDTFKCIFVNEYVWIPNKISLKFVPQGRINNILSLVQIMAWRRPGDKPLSEPMMVSYRRMYASLGPNELMRGTWTSAVVLLTTNEKRLFFLVDFQVPVLSQCIEMIKTANQFLVFLTTIQCEKH